MQVNGIKAYDYLLRGNSLDIVMECSVDEALAMDTAVVEIRTDAGDVVDVFAGFAAKSASKDAVTGRVTLTLYTSGDDTAQTTAALAKIVAEQQAQLDEMRALLEAKGN